MLWNEQHVHYRVTIISALTTSNLRLNFVKFCIRVFLFYLNYCVLVVGDSWVEGSLETSVEGKDIVGVISNLHPATTYSVQIVAENTLGTGEPSMELRVTTLEEAPSAAVRNIKVEATSSTQLLVSWDLPPSDHWNGVLLGHYVGHREAGWVWGEIYYISRITNLNGKFASDSQTKHSAYLPWINVNYWTR